MSIKVFVTGATGYIGGDALFEIVQAHPEWEITCLVRNHDKGVKISESYPGINLVYGDLDALELIEEEASKADIIYHFANCDHEPSAQAISRGLARRSRPGAGYWIHTSGAMILSTETIDKGCYGEALPKIFDDWDGVHELLSLPDHAEHRKVDKIVAQTSTAGPERIKTAIVSPPLIYGPGRGPDNQRGIQVNRAAEAYMKYGRAFAVGKGENIWNTIHVHDLSRLYLLLGEAAVKGDNPECWNENGYFLAENGSLSWMEVARALMAEISKQNIAELSQIEELSPDEAKVLLPYAKTLLGTNSRGTSIRAKRLLGWVPKEMSLLEAIPSIVEAEGARLNRMRKSVD